jgi:hypothetical protein
VFTTVNPVGVVNVTFAVESVDAKYKTVLSAIAADTAIGVIGEAAVCDAKPDLSNTAFA